MHHTFECLLLIQTENESRVVGSVKKAFVSPTASL